MHMIFDFFNDKKVIKAKMDPGKAPETCKRLANFLATPCTITTRHAMYTGPEMSMQLPTDDPAELLATPQEAATILPLPGQVLFTPLAANVWPGASNPILDIGVYYGPHARTFFPVGWLPGNAFASIIPADLATAQQLGASLLNDGQKKLIVSIEE